MSPSVADICFPARFFPFFAQNFYLLYNLDFKNFLPFLSVRTKMHKLFLLYYT